MKVTAYMCLHYGAEYLYESIKSIEPYVEKIFVLYTEKPSQGFSSTKIKNPDMELELNTIAVNASSKVDWRKVSVGTEGEHRSLVYGMCDSDTDLILAIDADEVYGSNLPQALEAAYKGDNRYYGINGYVNFWRSFSWHCIDSFRPVRITNLHNEKGHGEVECTIYHFSCAQRSETVRYKYLNFGHSSEIKDNYLEEVFFAWTPENRIRFLHPCSNDVWGDAFPFDKNTLPDLLKNHPNFDKDIIT